jgi:catechol 2,3-dioxygenase-like lactoylglutathione lyase family enzyme
MLDSAPVMITISVDNLEKATQFYQESLGLVVNTSTPGMLQLKLARGTELWIYEKKDHAPATYTVLNFTVDDLDLAMNQMRSQGVVFEQYDLPDTKTDENGIVDYGVMKIAFFNDPAGNNHAVLQMMDAQ